MTPELRRLALKWDPDGIWVGIDHVTAQALLDLADAALRHESECCYCCAETRLRNPLEAWCRESMHAVEGDLDLDRCFCGDRDGGGA